MIMNENRTRKPTFAKGICGSLLNRKPRAPKVGNLGLQECSYSRSYN